MDVGQVHLHWADAEATTQWGLRFGEYLAQAWSPSAQLRVGLEGGLGAGKSHLSRAILRGLGVTGAIPSPTYSLLETYPQAAVPAAHMDWYRLHDALELDMLDWEGLTQQFPLILVEWPSRLPERHSDFELWVELAASGSGRQATLRPRSPFTKGLVKQFDAA
nr:tRNA (adenosine(37)-N6)-threonylcarbamoyltransferase complex ATPase subunit type 1 TsaE [Oceanococcus sp. HetDA_MAG_MS8]